LPAVPSLPAGPLLADASFLIGVADALPTATRFVSVLNRCVVSSVNFGEVLDMLARKTGRAAQVTEQTFVRLGVKIENVGIDDVRAWPVLKDVDAASRAAQTAAGLSKVKSLSLTDLTYLGFAEHRHLPVLTGDRHWTTLGLHGLSAAVYDFRDEPSPSDSRTGQTALPPRWRAGRCCS
jgi:PIN domain nuclease of toxin-antitoxin system